jgi:hypothetical protein
MAGNFLVGSTDLKMTFGAKRSKEIEKETLGLIVIYEEKTGES